MSIALVIRNINPDRQDNSELVVITLTGQQPDLPAEFGLVTGSGQQVNTNSQMYTFPQKHNKSRLSPLRQEHVETCNLQDMEYLWCSSLDQAG